MIRRSHIALAGTLALLVCTACTDQPSPVEPPPTVEATTEDAESEALTDEAAMTSAIAQVLEHPDPNALLTGDEAVETLTGFIASDEHNTSSDDNQQCSTVTQTQPETAALGSVTDDSTATDDEDSGEPTARDDLGAFGFSSDDEAQAFTEELQSFMSQCSAGEVALEALTHHTDEAFEIQVNPEDETATSLVILRNDNAVFLVAATPPTDVALALTLTDQLDETLR